MIFVVTSVVGSVVIYVTAPMVGPRVMTCFREAGPPPDEPPPFLGKVPEEKVQALTEVSAPAHPDSTPPKTSGADDTSPALEGVYIARPGEPSGWGVTSHKISYYKADGSYVGTLEGGILFDCESTITTEKKGQMAKCRFLHEGMPDELFLIGRKDAMFYTGTHKSLSKARIQALKEYYALNGKIEARRSEILENGASQNPYFADARAAYETFQKSVQEAKRLEQLRDKLTDVKRMDLEDQLRELKMKEVGLKKTLDETNEKFAAWKKAHAAELPKPEDDADIKKWTQGKNQLVAALRGLVQ